MSATVSGRIWDDASAPSAQRLVRRFEADWTASRPDSRPDPSRYFPETISDRPGARLALLRAEMGLLRESGHPPRLEDYQNRFPDLDDETLVGLIYEEICLREDEGEHPDFAEYFERFPHVEERLRRVLDVHDLVGSARTVSLPGTSPPTAAPTFPDVGQTISGFHLVAELGRGSFARVFRAQERQLADRSVALKVARTGSREPQTLARLQHTHIVPVHSYRIDPCTGLHLLCMPYLGGVTLERLLSETRIPGARRGADLLAALDRLSVADGFRLDRGSAARRELAGRSFVRAVAWWGARMADALQHAHERGVLHRDIKPSNVLVTGDGVPMLLDFNLAWESHLDDPAMEGAGLGGTIAYMAPEHLEAVAEGNAGGVDARSDIYALGVLLYEVLAERPFSPLETARSVVESLLKAAERRRRGPRPIRECNPEVPAELAAVIHRCLAADPDDRYPDASSLAADLQAVADDLPLRVAREPVISRSRRWLRRNRSRIALVIPIALAPTMVVFTLGLAKLERAKLSGRLIGQVEQLIEEGRRLAKEENDILGAETRFATAYELASNGSDPRLDLLQAEARDNYHLAKESERIHEKARALLREAEPLKLRLLGFAGPVGDPTRVVLDVLNPFYVLSQDVDWNEHTDLTLLDPKLRRQVVDEIDTILFFWALALEKLESKDSDDLARLVCQRAIRTTELTGPWNALLQRIARDPEAAARTEHHLRVGKVDNARECFLWGVLNTHESRPAKAIEWLVQATRLDINEYWYHYYLGYLYQNVGDETLALSHYDVAVALRPELPWTRFNRSRVYQGKGAWGRALEDLDAALALTVGRDRMPMLLNRALVLESLGDIAAARQGYQQVLEEVGADHILGRAARLNLARLDAERGEALSALRAYEALIDDSNGQDQAARHGRALILARLGDLDEALQELDALLEREPQGATLLAERAEILLALGCPEESLEAAVAAYQIDPSPSNRRRCDRARLAAGLIDQLHFDHPKEVRELALENPSTWSDLRRIAAILESRQDLTSTLNLAVIQSALGDVRSAERLAAKAINMAPGSNRVRVVRARIRMHAGDSSGALDDLRRCLTDDPHDSRALDLRAEIELQQGDVTACLADLAQARSHGQTLEHQRLLAQALTVIGDYERALRAWTNVLHQAPESSSAYLGRAVTFQRLGQWDQAVADLEKASIWAGSRSDLLTPVAIAYLRCLPARPALAPRVFGVLRKVARSFLEREVHPEFAPKTYADGPQSVPGWPVSE